MWRPPKTLGVKLEAPNNVTFRMNIGKYTRKIYKNEYRKIYKY